MKRVARILAVLLVALPTASRGEPDAGSAPDAAQANGFRHWCISDDPAYREKIRKLEEETQRHIDELARARLEAIWKDWRRVVDQHNRREPLPTEVCPPEVPAEPACLAAISGDPLVCDAPSFEDPYACSLLAAVREAQRQGSPTPCLALSEDPLLRALCLYATGEPLDCPPSPAPTTPDFAVTLCSALADPAQVAHCFDPDAERQLCDPVRFLYALHSRLAAWCPPAAWGKNAASCRAAVFGRFDLCPPTTAVCSYPLWWCEGDTCALINLAPLRAHCRITLEGHDAVLPVEVAPRSSSAPLRLPAALRGPGPLHVECRWQRE